MIFTEKESTNKYITLGLTLVNGGATRNLVSANATPLKATTLPVQSTPLKDQQNNLIIPNKLRPTALPTENSNVNET